ncbi:MAG: LysM peptidoglycan-binding domain-containing protein [Candidatus Gracilibacteria bacterium]|nr:LysM peptidoglycan-binding domain-containing protein [Candidatus Gracilibacteria bacterium]MDD5179373.1 LysM peptidoglycan-binding domain-containing protein [Candidatus Gracilibacteria bacterium]
MRRNFNRLPQTSDYNEKNNPNYARQQRSLFKERGIFENRGGGRDAYLASVNANLAEARQELRSQGGSPEGLTILDTFQKLATAPDSLTTEQILAAKRMLEEVKASGGKSGSMKWMRPLEKAAAVLLLITSVLGIGGEAFAATQVEANQDTKRKTERKLTPADQKEYKQQLAENAGIGEISTTSYEVKKGDTLSGVLEEFLKKDLGRKPTREEREEALAKTALINGIRDINDIKAGDIIIIPSFKVEASQKIEVAPTEKVAAEAKADATTYEMKKSWRGEDGIDLALAEIFPKLYPKNFTELSTAERKIWRESQREIRKAVMKENELTSKRDLKDRANLIISEKLEKQAEEVVAETEAAKKEIVETEAEKKTKAAISKNFKSKIGMIRTDPETRAVAKKYYAEKTTEMSVVEMTFFTTNFLAWLNKFQGYFIVNESELKEAMDRMDTSSKFLSNFIDSTSEPNAPTSRKDLENPGNLGDVMREIFVADWKKFISGKGLPTGVKTYLSLSKTLNRPNEIKDQIETWEVRLADMKVKYNQAKEVGSDFLADVYTQRIQEAAENVKNLKQELLEAEKAAAEIDIVASVGSLIAMDLIVLKNLEESGLSDEDYLQALSRYVGLAPKPFNEELKATFATEKIQDLLIKAAALPSHSLMHIAGFDIWRFAIPEDAKKKISITLGENNPYEIKGKFAGEAQSIWKSFLAANSGINVNKLAAAESTSQIIGIITDTIKNSPFFREKEITAKLFGINLANEEIKSFGSSKEEAEILKRLEALVDQLKNPATAAAAIDGITQLLGETATTEKNRFSTDYEVRLGTFNTTKGPMLGVKGEMPNFLPGFKGEVNYLGSSNKLSVELKYRLLEKQLTEGIKVYADVGIGYGVVSLAAIGIQPELLPILFGSGKFLATGKLDLASFNQFSLLLLGGGIEVDSGWGGFMGKKQPDPVKLEIILAEFRKRLEVEEANAGGMPVMFVAPNGETYSRITPRGGVKMVDGNKNRVEGGVDIMLDPNHAVVLDIAVEPGYYEALASIVGEENLPEGWRLGNFDKVRVTLTAAAARQLAEQSGSEYEDWGKDTGGGAEIQLVGPNNEKLGAHVKFFQIGEGDWKNVDGARKKMLGGEATKFGVSGSKKFFGVELIAGVDRANYKTTGEKSRQETLAKLGMKTDLFGGQFEISVEQGDTTRDTHLEMKYTKGGMAIVAERRSNGEWVVGTEIVITPRNQAPESVNMMPNKGATITTVTLPSGLKFIHVGKDIHVISPGEIKIVRQKVQKLTEAASANNTADTLSVDVANNGGNTINAADAAATATATISDTLADGINDINKTALQSIATYKAEYKVGLGAWNPLTITGLGYNNGVLTFTVNTTGGPAAGDLFRITLTTAVGNLPAGTVIVGTNF